MQEVDEYYIVAEILLPRGNQIGRSQVVAWSHNASGNMGRSHTNAILDTRMYQVEFACGEATELTSNVIPEPMYAKCNIHGNEYLLLDMLVDFCKDSKAISLSDQQITVWCRLATTVE